MNDAAETTLTGVWDGLYSYASPHPESMFTAVLFDSGGALSGTIHETMRRPYGDIVAGAFVEGRVAGLSVTFTKTYDGTSGQTHAVAYEGWLNADQSEIEGTWAIALGATRMTGRFLMIRARRVSTATEVGIEVVA